MFDQLFYCTHFQKELNLLLNSELTVAKLGKMCFLIPSPNDQVHRVI